MFIEIPTYQSENWTVTSFETREDFADFVLSIFKEPGLYNFTKMSFLFNKEANRFNKDGFYC